MSSEPTPLQWPKRPVVVEAVQYQAQEYADNPLTFEHIPAWLQQAIVDGVIRPEFRSEDYWYLVIKTAEGEVTVSPRDWIIRGIQGELYPCKPDIFFDTYVPAAWGGEVPQAHS